jgi:6-phosphogluconolactonase/glucosamine-6-phosphate isomerase/deaminase
VTGLIVVSEPAEPVQPPDHAESNYRMVHLALLSRVAIPAGQAAMVARAIEGPLAPKAVPVQLAWRGVWFLDRAAAARLAARRVAT